MTLATVRQELQLFAPYGRETRAGRRRGTSEGQESGVHPPDRRALRCWSPGWARERRCLQRGLRLGPFLGFLVSPRGRAGTTVTRLLLAVAKAFICGRPERRSRLWYVFPQSPVLTGESGSPFPSQHPPLGPFRGGPRGPGPAPQPVALGTPRGADVPN